MQKRFTEVETFKEYVELSKKTMSDDSYEIDLYHASSGIHGEIWEIADAFTEKDLKKEIGDLCFYMAVMHTRHEFQFGGGTDNTDSKDEVLTRMKRLSAELSEHVKKRCQYKKENVLEIQRVCHKISNLVFILANGLGFSVVDILTGNLEKLQGENGRYKDGFTQQEAINRRDTKTELEKVL